MHQQAVEILEQRLAEMRAMLNEKINYIERMLVGLDDAMSDATGSIAAYGQLKQTVRSLTASQEIKVVDNNFDSPPKSKK